MNIARSAKKQKKKIRGTKKKSKQAAPSTNLTNYSKPESNKNILVRRSPALCQHGVPNYQSKGSSKNTISARSSKLCQHRVYLCFPRRLQNRRQPGGRGCWMGLAED